MRLFLRAVASVALAVVVTGAGATAAQAQTREADAERLFREGQKLLEERRYGEACPKFEQAYKKDGALGTLLNLAFCHKEQGATWYAWLEFREAESKATELNRPDRRDFAHARLTELEKGLPKVVVDNPRKLPLSEVLVEDRKVWEAERGSVFAVESGARKFTFRAKGKKPATILVQVVRGDRPQRVSVPELELLTADDVPPPPAPATIPEAPPRRDAVTPRPAAESSSPQKTIGWVALGVGSAGTALGLVTGAITIFGPCGGKDCTAAERSSTSTTAAISTIATIGGLTLLATGVVLVLTAPEPGGTASARSTRDRQAATSRLVVTPSIGPTSLGLSGTF